MSKTTRAADSSDVEWAATQVWGTVYDPERRERSGRCRVLAEKLAAIENDPDFKGKFDWVRTQAMAYQGMNMTEDVAADDVLAILDAFISLVPSLAGAQEG